MQPQSESQADLILSKLLAEIGYIPTDETLFNSYKSAKIALDRFIDELKKYKQGIL